MAWQKRHQEPQARGLIETYTVYMASPLADIAVPDLGNGTAS